MLKKCKKIAHQADQEKDQIDFHVTQTVKVKQGEEWDPNKSTRIEREESTQSTSSSSDVSNLSI